MTGSRLEMPPLKVAASILRETTERLASEVVSPGMTAPQWSDLHWAIAPASAAIHGTSVLLHRRLRWQGPPSWEAYLENQNEHSVRRDRRLANVLQKLDAELHNENVGVVALKGASIRTLGIYDEGERSTSDIDVLVSPNDLRDVETALETLGYRRALAARRHDVWKRPGESAVHGFGEHERNAVPIEVHTSVLEHLPVRSIDITQRLWPTPLQPGLNSYPATNLLMLHLLLHAAGNFRRKTLRQIQLHDIAMLADHLSSADWDVILRSMDFEQPRWWLYPVLAITDRYYSKAIPEQVLQMARRMCPAMLRTATRSRTLTDVSFSDLRIAAFPGLEWSGTPMEAVRFMRSRIIPSRVALEELRADIDSNQQLRQLPWYRIRHSARIARWVSGRAPRVQTMLSLRDAIGYANEACS